MNYFLPMLLLWALLGWCGTPYPGWWPFPWPRPDPPEPRPRPNWLVGKLIGMAAGVLGGWLYTQVFDPTQPVPWNTAVNAAASGVGAFVLARVVGDIYGAMTTGGNKPAG